MSADQLINTFNNPKNIVGWHKLLDDNGPVDLEELERKIMQGDMAIHNKPDVNPEEEGKKFLAAQEAELKNMGVDMDALNLGMPLDPDNVHASADYRPSYAPPVTDYSRPTYSEPATYNLPKIEHKDKYFNQVTQEEMRKSVMSQIIPKTVDDPYMNIIDQEQQENDKTGLLAQISSIIEVLESENVKGLEKYKVSETDSYDKIKKVHSVIMNLHLTRRYQEIFETGITEFAGFIESTFDGKKEVLGYKPNMKNYRMVASNSMRKLRPQTMQIVNSMFGTGGGSSIMSNPFVTVSLHLFLGMLMHAKLNSMDEGKTQKKMAMQEIDSMKEE